MFSLITPTGSFDDIVFEGRNQAYGAFQLRRSYQSHLGSALAITIAAGTLLLLSPLAIHYFFPEEAVMPLPAYKTAPAEPKYYELPKAKPVVQQAAHVEVTVIPHAVIKTQIARDQDVQPEAISNLPTDVGKTGPAQIGAVDTDGAATSTGAAIAPGVDTARPAPASAPTVMLAPEVMPDFVGGRAALQRYLQKHLRFPAAAIAAQASGRVYVSFVVQTDGSIGEVTVLKGLGFGTEEEAARVVRSMPAWTPGLQNHHAVPVRFTLPITFQFE